MKNTFVNVFGARVFSTKYRTVMQEMIGTWNYSTKSRKWQALKTYTFTYLRSEGLTPPPRNWKKMVGRGTCPRDPCLFMFINKKRKN